MLEGGAPIRVLAVYHDKRLPGRLSDVPTAIEQGYNIQWPIIRGFYMGPKVSDTDFTWWTRAFESMMSAPEFAKLREQQGLFPFTLTGSALDQYVKARVKEYAELADTFGLIKK